MEFSKRYMIGLYILAIVAFQSVSIAQTPLEVYHIRKQRIETRSMIALTVWSATNISVGTYQGIKLDDSDDRYFHQMNVYWNLVNLPIAIYVLVKAKKEDPPTTWEEMREHQRKTEKSLLINGCLDIAYMGGGLAMAFTAKNTNHQNIIQGFGESILLQSFYLLVADFVQYGLHKAHRKKKMISEEEIKSNMRRL